MKTFQEITLTIRKNRKELEENYGLRKIGVFGSCAREEQDRNSDIDILIEAKDLWDWLSLCGLNNIWPGCLRRGWTW